MFRVKKKTTKIGSSRYTRFRSMDTDQSIPQFRDNATIRSHDIFFIYSQLSFKYRASARVRRINIRQIVFLTMSNKKDTRDISKIMKKKKKKN